MTISPLWSKQTCPIAVVLIRRLPSLSGLVANAIALTSPFRDYKERPAGGRRRALCCPCLQERSPKRPKATAWQHEGQGLPVGVQQNLERIVLELLTLGTQNPCSASPVTIDYGTISRTRRRQSLSEHLNGRQA